MLLSRDPLRTVCAVSLWALSAMPVGAAIVVDPDGKSYTDVVPVDPASWDNTTTGEIGGTTRGDLLVDGASTLLNRYGYIGSEAGSTGIVTVNGSNAGWDLRYWNEVGRYGNGTLNITGGALVACGSSARIGMYDTGTGVATVDGTDSTWTCGDAMYVGWFGTGELNITNGGAVSNIGARVGYQAGGNGTVAISGSASRWTVDGELTVGDLGTGLLQISGGAIVNVATNTWVSRQGGTTGGIEMSGGAVVTQSLFAPPAALTGVGAITAHGLVSDVAVVFDATHGLSQNVGIHQNVNVALDVDGTGAMGAGYTGTGSLSVSDGLDVACTTGYLGYHAGSTGTATVAGAGSTFSAGAGLHVGFGGSGALNINNGGVVNVTGETRVADQAGSTGQLNFSNGTLNTDGLFVTTSDVAGTGTINTHSIVSDVSLTFDSTHGAAQTVTVNENVQANLNFEGTAAVGVGYAASAALSVSQGAELNSTQGYLGYHVGSSGTATVTGTGSTWNHSQELLVGIDGHGELHITNGGAVSGFYSHIAANAGSTGAVTVDGAGSTWTDTGNIEVGYGGSGTMAITNGAVVTSSFGYVGHDYDSTGVATIDGAGSAWNSTRCVVGYNGNGTLSIVNGGNMTNTNYSYIAWQKESVGTVLVDGAGSAWNSNGSSIWVGYFGQGKLTVSNGATVTAHYSLLTAGQDEGGADVYIVGPGSSLSAELVVRFGSVGSAGTARGTIADGGTVNAGTHGETVAGSRLSVLVSNNGMFNVTNDYTNGGTTRLAAEPGLVGGTYTPITVGGSWLGAGTYEAFGGKWNTSLHQFIVSAADYVASGQRADIDLLTQQRVVVGDGLVMDFMPTTTSNPLAVTATVTSGQMLADLEDLVGPDGRVEGSYGLSVSGLSAGDRVMLFFAAAGASGMDDLTVWHYDGTWQAITPDDLVLAGGWTSFTVDTFSSYAVSSIPEPASLTLAALGALAVVRRRRRHTGRERQP